MKIRSNQPSPFSRQRNRQRRKDTFTHLAQYHNRSAPIAETALSAAVPRVEAYDTIPLGKNAT